MKNKCPYVFKSRWVRFSAIVAEGISFGRRPCSANNVTLHISAQLGLTEERSLATSVTG